MLQLVAHAIEAEPDAYRNAQKERNVELVEVVFPPFLHLGEREDSNAEKHHYEGNQHPSGDYMFHRLKVKCKCIK